MEEKEHGSSDSNTNNNNNNNHNHHDTKIIDPENDAFLLEFQRLQNTLSTTTTKQTKKRKNNNDNDSDTTDDTTDDADNDYDNDDHHHHNDINDKTVILEELQSVLSEIHVDYNTMCAQYNHMVAEMQSKSKSQTQKQTQAKDGKRKGKSNHNHNDNHNHNHNNNHNHNHNNNHKNLGSFEYEMNELEKYLLLNGIPIETTDHNNNNKNAIQKLKTIHKHALMHKEKEVAQMRQQNRLKIKALKSEKREIVRSVQYVFDELKDIHEQELANHKNMGKIILLQQSS